MSKKQLIPKEQTSIWFQQLEDGEISWGHLTQWATEAAPSVTEPTLKRWHRDWKRERNGEAPKPRTVTCYCTEDGPRATPPGPTPGFVVTREYLAWVREPLDKLADILDELKRRLVTPEA